jgi:hypothetical protein
MTTTSAPPLRVLHAAAEIFPLVKTGGLADVVGALPPALLAAGADARLLLPGMPAILEAVSMRRGSMRARAVRTRVRTADRGRTTCKDSGCSVGWRRSSPAAASTPRGGPTSCTRTTGMPRSPAVTCA